MRALTLWQPWASLVASGVKRIENRPWAPPAWMLNETFAIHAGLRYDRDSAATAEELGGYPLPKSECPRGAIIATCSLIAVARSAEEAVRFADGDRSQERWFFGPYGWVLDDIEAIDPVPCRGFQGLWNIPDDIKRRVATWTDLA